jgi:phage terminase large subunit-like protein
VTSDTNEYVALARQVELKRQEIRLREGLPYLYGWPWYTWAWEFFESRAKMNFLCAANQVSKSSTQIRKCIHWATAQDLWPELWVRKPVQFWYMYPSQKVANAEFLTKWSQFLPKGEFKHDPYYGWKEQYDKGNIVAIHFNSGVHVFFKAYSQDVMDLQTGTLDALFLDEELPEEYWDELAMRVNATDGYIHMVFTATLGQDFWRQTMEPREDEEERLSEARKWCVSLYDSRTYMDGTPSQWTDAKIAQVKARCKSHAEFLKRVMGRFVVVGGRKYESFDATRHMKPKHPVPKDWLIWEGVDIGGGSNDPGSKTHKSAICFVAVKPDFRAGRVFLGWRGDGVITTSGDVFQKHLELKKTLHTKPLRMLYDWGNKDFGTISTRAGEPFEKADKGHDKGEDIINTLFKNDMLMIYEDPELSKLAGELSTLMKLTPKNKAKDDFADAFRYAVTTVPWDFTFLTGAIPLAHDDTPEKPMNNREREIADRMARFEGSRGEDEEQYTVEDEIEEWNDLYGG